ncbi:pyrroline-5-carboxylate reductase [Natronospira proteinivora]|uniref:Pyrroline-5-carboxylate reductase n=1 Tax=Natronospira proteinivora TaxID=1807133 RepID=A0ABT1GDR4_9GAMM|nr:pyrroline-5-carboxylate reductase [Natronospira proteinivora]MCP1728393.1 pyrroline-5-carboxylate reductase [Natronospira proteinivora]
MSEGSIAFIGGGNMAESLVGGLIADGRSPESIWVADPFVDKLDELRYRHKVNVTQENTEAAAHADVIVMAVKPQVLREAAAQIKDLVQENRSVVLSIAAGLREPDISRWLGGNVPVVRAMPNTPALLQTGATVLYANSSVDAEQKKQAETIMAAVGMTLWVEEEGHMDAVTATSGSGPAYFFLVMEAMQAAAQSLGLPGEVAEKLVQQTALGAARMAREGEDDAATLREKVTSPGGTTAAALEVLREAGIEETFTRALTAARDRSRSLSDEFGKD